jgi:peptidoglycan/xylan/chitin deacetylase (PgdA/CDA1 family)
VIVRPACDRGETFADATASRSTRRSRAFLVKYALPFTYNFAWLRALSSRRPIVLLYHGIPAADSNEGVDGWTFAEHVRLLSRFCDFVAVDDVATSRKTLDKIRLLLTFDDGFRNNAEVVAPILRRYGVPATFFVCSRHATQGKYLWFAYFQALESYFPARSLTFRGTSFDMSAERRRSSVRALVASLVGLRPHPSAMYDAIERELPPLEDFVAPAVLRDRYEGMPIDEVAALASDPLFAIGAHTVDHPLLTRCPPDEARRQLRENVDWIEQGTKRRCAGVAYPSGDYDAGVLRLVRELGLGRGFAVVPHVKSARDLEIPRIGIYSASTEILGFKMQWGNWLRSLRIRIG